MSNRRSRQLGSRAQRKKRPLKLGGYLIITDAKETESNYFKGFRDRLGAQALKDLQIKVIPSIRLQEIIAYAEEERDKDERFREVWLIFDRDRVVNFDELIDKAGKHGMKVGWSNPCFEIWLSNYFANARMQSDPTLCCNDFKKLLIKHTPKSAYDKADTNLYAILMQHGCESDAIQRAKVRLMNQRRITDIPSEMLGCTTVFQLVEEIRCKAQ